ncbi:MAG: murein biosynthesis integral membrane protein MurJ [Patescibacteria group bacterium]|jgi:putative peptidoglycan lipid II flippase
MFKKLFHGQSSSIVSAAVIIGVAGLASRLLGVVRDRIIAGEFGAGQVTDIYYAAFRIPDLIYNFLVLGALSAGFIPVFIEYLRSEDRDEWELASGVLNAVVVCIIGLSAVFFVFAPWIISWLSPGFTAAAQVETVNLTRIMLLSPLFLGISAIFGGILQSLKKFFIYSFAPIFYNVGIMVGALVFVRWWGISGLAWGVALGAFLHMAIQIPAAVASGFRYQPILSFRHPGIRKIIKLTIPRTLGLVVSQINLFVITIIASTLAVGSIATFTWANNLQGFLIGIFAVSFAIAAFPSLTAAAIAGEGERFVSIFTRTARQILFFIIPL